MENMQMVSIELQGNFGFFRKPETNNTLNVSFNILHKPALLGILGAIIGLKGYQKKGELPEYYEKLHGIKVGVAPMDTNNGNFNKTPIKYSNTVGYANKGTNFLTEELTLVAPTYRIFLLLDKRDAEQKKLLEYLENGYTEYIPYFGKNEFAAWWDKESFTNHPFRKAEISEGTSVKMQSMFFKNQILKDNTETVELDFFSAASDDSEQLYMYFERLPVGFDLGLIQYKLKEMVYTNYLVKNVNMLPDVICLMDQDSYVQVH